MPLVAAVLLLGACSSADRREPASTAPTSETTVSVVLTDWSVTADPATSAPGAVTFDIEVDIGNHALTVLRTDLPPGELPTNGPVNVDVTDERIEIIATDAASPRSRTLEADLDPGSYALICNVGGHYARGMWTGFDVA